MQTAASGLIAAQTGLRTVSDNIANVNTPGYVRKTVNQQPLVVGGMGMGVEVSGVKRVTDQYLQIATLSATADSSRWDAVSQYLDNAQSLFGDPSSTNFFFSRLDDIYSSFSAAANDPSSSLLRSQALADTQDFLNEGARINTQIGELGKTVDAQASADVSRINDLLKQITSLNSDVSRARLSKADSSGSENIQSQLVDELSGLMNIQIAQRANGGVTLRSAEGYELAGDAAATLSYNKTDATKGYIAIEPPDGLGGNKPITITGGALRGLMDMRDDTLPAMSDQLGEFMSRATDSINAAHNAASAVPAPASLTGRNTGLDLATALSGFKGVSTVAILNSAGVPQKTVAIDFDNMTMSVDGAAGTSFSAGNFEADLTAALGGAGTASFSNGALTIATANPGDGVAIDEGTSQKAGKAFSHFFGLNDLIRSAGVTTYETGLAGTDPNGFTPGDTISFRLAQDDGKPLRDVTITIPSGGTGTMDELVATLNNSSTGVGLYGQFNLNDKGTLAFTPYSPLNATLSVTKDNTARGGAGGVPMSQLFGLGVVQRSVRANQFQVDPAMVSDPNKLALAKLDLTVAAGQPALRAGDGAGALAIAASGDVPTTFDAAGQLGKVTMTVARYASEFGGSVGRQAAAAETQKQASASVATEATARRQSVEGVNLDEELVRLTTYQQAFNASARMVQATKELFDVLTNMI
jgi:flagellar hook-associated protein 1 FlgK